AENCTRRAGRGRAIGPSGDCGTGPARAERQRAHQKGPVRFRRVGDILEPRRLGDAGRNGDCAHPAPRLARTGVAADAVRDKGFGACSERCRRAFRQTPLTTSLRQRQKKVPAGETKMGPSALSFLLWENGGTAGRPSDGGDGQSRKATSPPKARFPTARSSPTRPPASSTPASRTRASPLPSSSPTGSRSAPTA